MSAGRTSAFAQAWGLVYRVPGRRGYASTNKEFNDYAAKTSTRILTFLGLSLRPLTANNPFNWPDALSMAFNVVMLVPTLAKNVVKLLTEFLPLFGHFAAKHQLDQNAVKNSLPKRIVFNVLAGVCYALNFIGRAMTSPSRGVRKAYSATYESDGVAKRVPKPVGVALALLSGLMTATVYAVALPFVLSVAAPSVLAAGAALVAKSAVATAAVKGFAVVGSFLTTALQAVGIASIPAAVVGVSSLAATAATAGCAAASEVGIRVKGSTAKINRSLPSTISNSVVPGSMNGASQGEKSDSFRGSQTPPVSVIAGQNPGQDESSSSYSDGSSVYPSYPPVDESSGVKRLTNSP